MVPPWSTYAVRAPLTVPRYSSLTSPALPTPQQPSRSARGILLSWKHVPDPISLSRGSFPAQQGSSACLKSVSQDLDSANPRQKSFVRPVLKKPGHSQALEPDPPCAIQPLLSQPGWVTAKGVSIPSPCGQEYYPICL